MSASTRKEQELSDTNLVNIVASQHGLGLVVDGHGCAFERQLIYYKMHAAFLLICVGGSKLAAIIGESIDTHSSAAKRS